MSKEVTKLTKTEPQNTNMPAFVEAEKMFDKLAEITIVVAPQRKCPTGAALKITGW